MKPFKIDPDGVPVFSNLDIDDYGFPELYGYQVYRVVESREMVAVTDYQQEQEYDLRPKHRYCRLSRFKATLYNLLGLRGNVPQHVFDMCRTYMDHKNPDKWNACRRILKCFKQREYYDCIPTILRKLCGKRCYPSLTGEQLEAIITDFKFLSDKFDRVKHNYNLRYFPNIRFVVFKLLEHHGHETTYPVPLVRTDRKRKSLNKLWDDLLA